jgi:hypothetical protein
LREQIFLIFRHGSTLHPFGSASKTEILFYYHKNKNRGCVEHDRSFFIRNKRRRLKETSARSCQSLPRWGAQHLFQRGVQIMLLTLHISDDSLEKTNHSLHLHSKLNIQQHMLTYSATHVARKIRMQKCFVCHTDASSFSA